MCYLKLAAVFCSQIYLTVLLTQQRILYEITLMVSLSCSLTFVMKKRTCSSRTWSFSYHNTDSKTTNSLGKSSDHGFSLVHGFFAFQNEFFVSKALFVIFIEFFPKKCLQKDYVCTTIPAFNTVLTSLWFKWE